jgi:hypothetical protein
MTLNPWPGPFHSEWRPTLDALHLRTQVVGKIRMALTPPANHWWHVPLYLSARGLTTSPMTVGATTVEAAFDFVGDQLTVTCDSGARRDVPLEAMSTAVFLERTLAAFRDLGVEAHIWPTPVERPDPIPFAQDTAVRPYDPAAARWLFEVLVRTQAVMSRLRNGYLGKASPMHFFWGSFDLALSRFSGRPAPVHPSTPGVADSVTREAYSHEVASWGFWPGAGAEPPMFYAYAYPTPDGFAAAKAAPGASFRQDLGEFVLPYDTVARADDPDAMLTAFFETAYAAAADLGGWDRKALER